ncbi:MAG: hypothetical protein IJ693_01230 [Bacteroidaceae bacterium]|nr:hypothetical protein [Bacteroidaceae bacterium]
MKKVIFAIAALALVAWGCSSSDDDTPSKPESLLEGTDARPTWQVPNFDDYEQIMTVVVVLEDTLQSYASVADLLCATIEGEVRGVATPQQVGEQWRFVITVASNESGKDISLSYYCDKLHHIFTTYWGKFDANTKPTGEGTFYQPTFVTQE